MAAPERAFQPETQRRIDAKAKKAARLKAAALDALDIGKPAPRFRAAIDQAIDETLETVDERAALRLAADARALGRGSSEQIQAAQRALAAKKAELRGERPAAEETGSRRARLDAWLSGLSSEQRDQLIGSDALNDLSAKEQDHVFRRLAELDTAELGVEGAELKHAIQTEQRVEANFDPSWESEQWSREQAERGEEHWDAVFARRLRDESDALTEAELRAEEDLAAAISGPLFVGDPEGLYDDDEEEVEE